MEAPISITLHSNWQEWKSHCNIKDSIDHPRKILFVCFLTQSGNLCYRHLVYDDLFQMIELKKMFLQKSMISINNIFFTQDRQGKRSICDDTEFIFDHLQDGQIIYPTYVYVNNYWRKSLNYNTSCCTDCGTDTLKLPLSQRYKLLTGFRSLLYCSKCMPNPARIKGICIKCGARECSVISNGLEGAYKTPSIRSENVYVAQCEGKCRENPEIRTCSVCHVPIEHRLKCGKCFNRIYCTRECQAKDWPAHRLNCK